MISKIISSFVDEWKIDGETRNLLFCVFRVTTIYVDI